MLSASIGIQIAGKMKSITSSIDDAVNESLSECHQQLLDAQRMIETREFVIAKLEGELEAMKKRAVTAETDNEKLVREVLALNAQIQ
ncbi:hypothetical protein CTI12_AA410910 [Artemisia annua]|uniref:Uncharacterized protein n=1 Tax=Artemisia annua TaxID=35608 RepID=A0A2U1M7L8_ARTAN|nr:hypothetical protein CTI12_AA410910 [Artemisia annua]